MQKYDSDYADQQRKDEQNTIPQADQMQQWAQIGDSIATAIAKVCQTLNVEVNNFVKTPVGALTMFLIVVKVINIWGVLGGTLAWIILGLVIWKSFHFFHMPERRIEENGEIKYIPRYDWTGEESKTTSVVVHVISFLALSITCLLIIF